MEGVILFIICMIMGLAIGYVVGKIKASEGYENLDGLDEEADRIPEEGEKEC